MKAEGGRLNFSVLLIHPSAFLLHPFHAAPLLGFLAGHNRPTDGLGVGEDSGLDGFVFGRLAHSTGLGW